MAVEFKNPTVLPWEYVKNESVDADDTGIHISATVKNTSNEDDVMPTVSYVLFDKNKKPIQAGFFLCDEIKAGETSTVSEDEFII